jgi:hypothetical protein
MLRRWRETVAPEEVILHVGDVALGPVDGLREHLVTPAWDLIHDQDTWDQFLFSLGYAPHTTDEQLFIQRERARKPLAYSE